MIIFAIPLRHFTKSLLSCFSNRKKIGIHILAIYAQGIAYANKKDYKAMNFNELVLIIAVNNESFIGKDYAEMNWKLLNPLPVYGGKNWGTEYEINPAWHQQP